MRVTFLYPLSPVWRVRVCCCCYSRNQCAVWAVHFPAACKNEAKWMFGHLDINSDGLLSVSEMYDLEHDQNERCIKPFIDTCDLDKDNNLSPREWCRCFEKTDRPCAAVRRRLGTDLFGKLHFCVALRTRCTLDNASTCFWGGHSLIDFRCFHFQADMHPIVTFRASTSQHNATVQSACAGASTSTASNLRIHAQEANPIAVNEKLKQNTYVSCGILLKRIPFYLIRLDEVIVNAAALTSDDEDDESDDDDDDDSTEGSADNMLAF